MKNKMFVCAALALAIMMIIACAPAAQPTAVPPTQAPPATQAAVPTQAPAPTQAVAPTQAAATTVPVAAFTGDKLAAPNCDYKTGDLPGLFKSIEAVDAKTVKFTLCTPDPAFPAKVAFISFGIQDKDLLNETGGDSTKLSDKPNGTGPYKVKDWVRGDHITFEANPDYWGEPAKNKTLIFRWSKEAAQRLLELQAGTVDGIDNPAPDDFAAIEKDSKIKLYPREGLNVFYFGMNNTIKPFDNEKVRQAVAMAVDRKRLVDNFYPGGSSVAEQFVPPPFNPGFSTSGEGSKWYEYNPTKAKELLKEAGFEKGFEVELSYRDVVRGYLPLPGKVAQDLQAQLADVGITAKIVVEESGPFLQNVAAGTEPLFLLGWGADYPDATNFYDFHFASASKRFGTEHPDLVAEIKAAAALAEPVARQKHYDKVNELIKLHVPMVPMAHGGSGTVFGAGVKGAHASPLGNENFAVMNPGKDQFVWMQNAEPISLNCADETDGETLRACEQFGEGLLAYEVGGVKVVSALAEKFEPNADLTEWTFTLRDGVKFHNGATLDANDVVATFAAQWDAKNPNHKGNTGVFEYFSGFFGAFLNKPE